MSDTNIARARLILAADSAEQARQMHAALLTAVDQARERKVPVRAFSVLGHDVVVQPVPPVDDRPAIVKWAETPAADGGE